MKASDNNQSYMALVFLGDTGFLFLAASSAALRMFSFLGSHTGLNTAAGLPSAGNLCAAPLALWPRPDPLTTHTMVEPIHNLDLN